VKSIKYLSFIIKVGKGIRIDPKKIEAIKTWESPTIVKGIRGFLGFANFYRRFIRDYSRVTVPLTELTKKNRLFNWITAAENAF